MSRAHDAPFVPCQAGFKWRNCASSSPAPLIVTRDISRRVRKEMPRLPKGSILSLHAAPGEHRWSSKTAIRDFIVLG